MDTSGTQLIFYLGIEPLTLTLDESIKPIPSPTNSSFFKYISLHCRCKIVMDHHYQDR